MLLFDFKSWICFIHMKLKENIERVIKSDVDCIFKCQYDFLKLWNLLGYNINYFRFFN
jgi:hypothetical protein